MRRYVTLCLILLFPALLHARSLTVDTTQTGVVNCSTNSASPTLLFTSDPNAVRSYIVNYSTTNIYLGFQSTTSTATAAAFSISTSSGNFYLVGGSTMTFSPDGTTDVFTGPMWCVAQTGANFLNRIRFH